MDSSNSKNGRGDDGPVQRVRILTPIPWNRVAWVTGIVLFLALVVLLGSIISSVSIPLLLGLAFAYVINPLVDWLERLHVPRGVGVLMILVVLTAVLVVGLALAGPQIADEFRQLPAKLERLFENFAPWVERTFGVTLPESIPAALDALGKQLTQGRLTSLLEPTGNILGQVFSQSAAVLGGIIGVLALPIFAFFLARDFNRIFTYLRHLVPPASRPRVLGFFREFGTVMSGFLRGQLLVALILAVLYSIGLALVGVPLAYLVGIISGLGNLVPYLGTFLGIVLATLMTLLSWEGIVKLLLVYLVYALVQLLEGWLITPKIVGSSVGLSPFVVILSVLAFGELLGFFGILVAIPLAGTLKILLRMLVHRYEQSALYQRGA